MISNDIIPSHKDKAGILTFYYVYNYGAVLQAYALKSYLTSKGMDVEIIPYVSEYIYKNYSINPFTSKKGKRDQLEKLKHLWRNYQRIRPFLDFQRKDLKVKKGKFQWSDYDILIVGSDQVWNFEITGNDTYYLGEKACSEQNIISYAASFGVRNLPDGQKDIFRRYLQKFDFLTVREESGVAVLKELGLNGQRVCDPVFLLEKREWSTKSKKVAYVEKKPYIFVYLLEYNEELISQVFETARKNNLDIYSAHPTGRRWGLDVPFINNCGPWEFVYLIEHAQYVATNSFHAMSFSLIFEKDIIYVPHKTRGNRTEELFSMVNYAYFNTDRDYSLLNSLIEDSRMILNEALGV